MKWYVRAGSEVISQHLLLPSSGEKEGCVCPTNAKRSHAGRAVKPCSPCMTSIARPCAEFRGHYRARTGIDITGAINHANKRSGRRRDDCRGVPSEIEITTPSPTRSGFLIAQRAPVPGERSRRRGEDKRPASQKTAGSTGTGKPKRNRTRSSRRRWTPHHTDTRRAPCDSDKMRHSASTSPSSTTDQRTFDGVPPSDPRYGMPYQQRRD